MQGFAQYRYIHACMNACMHDERYKLRYITALFVFLCLFYHQFGGQSLFRDEEGREALNEVVKVLVIGLLNIFVFEVLSFALERSLNPLPAACVFFACIAKLW